jgi:hypothetical protein
LTLVSRAILVCYTTILRTGNFSLVWRVFPSDPGLVQEANRIGNALIQPIDPFM